MSPEEIDEKNRKFAEAYGGEKEIPKFFSR